MLEMSHKKKKKELNDYIAQNELAKDRVGRDGILEEQRKVRAEMGRLTKYHNEEMKVKKQIINFCNTVHTFFDVKKVK